MSILLYFKFKIYFYYSIGCFLQCSYENDLRLKFTSFLDSTLIFNIDCTLTLYWILTFLKISKKFKTLQIFFSIFLQLSSLIFKEVCIQFLGTCRRASGLRTWSSSSMDSRGSFDPHSIASPARQDYIGLTRFNILISIGSRVDQQSGKDKEQQIKWTCGSEN